MTIATRPDALRAITLADLRRANEQRQALWCPDPSQQPDLSFRAMELGGEVGEALNVAKKLVREKNGWRGSRATTGDLGEELADVVICADLVAMTEGIDLAAAVVAKFDATSRKVGLPVVLRSAEKSETALFTRDQFEPDENEAGIHFSRFISGLTDWVAMQPGPVTATEAARAWNTTPDVIREAADEAVWLFLNPDDTLELEGE